MEAIYNEKNFQKVLKNSKKLFKRICNKYHFTNITDICIDGANEKMKILGQLVNIRGIHGSLVNTYGYWNNSEQIFVNVARDIVTDNEYGIYFDEINTYTSYEEACEQIEKILKKYKMLQLEIKQNEIKKDFQ